MAGDDDDAYLVVDARADRVASLLEPPQFGEHVLVGRPHLEAVDAASAVRRRARPCPAVDPQRAHRRRHGDQQIESKPSHAA